MSTPPSTHLFIVTYGRTGSTLLQSLLNSFPNVRIGGENNGALYYLFRAGQAIDRLQVAGTESPTHPFFGSHEIVGGDTVDAIADVARGIVAAGTNGEDIIGFKEVRYDVPDFQEFLSWLDSVFPNSKFVFLTRDTDQVGKSGFWKNVPEDQVRNAIDYVSREFETFSRDRPAQSFTIDYRDLAEASPRLRALVEWLGLEYIEDQIRQVMVQPHSYDTATMRFFTDSALQLHRNQEIKQSISYFFLDSNYISSGQRNISGAIVPVCDQAVAVQMEVIQAGEDTARTKAAVEISSPRLAARSPDNPNAKNARFKLNLPDDPGYYYLVASWEDKRIKMGNLIIGSTTPRSSFDK